MASSHKPLFHMTKQVTAFHASEHSKRHLVYQEPGSDGAAWYLDESLKEPRGSLRGMWDGKICMEMVRPIGSRSERHWVACVLMGDNGNGDMRTLSGSSSIRSAEYKFYLEHENHRHQHYTRIIVDLVIYQAPPLESLSALPDVPLAYLGRLLKDVRLLDPTKVPGAEELKSPRDKGSEVEDGEEAKAESGEDGEAAKTEPLEEAREDFADFRLVSGGEAVFIHRAIFAAASDVFRKIFTKDMADKARGFAQIDDVPAQTLRGLKAFLYTGALEQVRQDLAGYLDLSELYAIKELKAFCAEEMSCQLSSSTVCSTAVLAERYGLGELVDKCGVLLRPIATGPEAPADWAQLKREHTDLAFRLLGV